MVEGNTEQCATHNAEDRKNERHALKQKVVRQVMKVTPKRAGELQEYYKLRKEYLEAYPCCEIEDCNLKSVDVHHKGTRANQNLLDTDFYFAVCRKHHVMITEDSAWAKLNGYSVMRTT